MSKVAESALARKLLIQAGQRVLILKAPPGYVAGLHPLPDGATTSEQETGPHDVVQLFAQNRAQLERDAGAALRALKPGGVLWISYPKPSTGPESDLSRDHGWGVLHGAGLVAVTQISVADDWNALRWLPNAEAVAAGHVSAEVPPADLLPVGRRATLAYRLVRLVAVPALRLSFRFEIRGREHVPRTGTYIVIANHLGWLDALTLAMVFPIEPRIHFLADPTGMMRRRLEWALIRATGGIIPVDRARRQATLRTTKISYGTQISGPSATKSKELALIEPTSNNTRANAAGHRHPPRRRACAVSTMNQGSAAHAPSNTECRATYGNTYGESW